MMSCVRQCGSSSARTTAVEAIRSATARASVTRLFRMTQSLRVGVISGQPARDNEGRWNALTHGDLGK